MNVYAFLDESSNIQQDKTSSFTSKGIVIGMTVIQNENDKMIKIFYEFLKRFYTEEGCDKDNKGKMHLSNCLRKYNDNNFLKEKIYLRLLDRKDLIDFIKNNIITFSYIIRKNDDFNDRYRIPHSMDRYVYGLQVLATYINAFKGDCVYYNIENLQLVGSIKNMLDLLKAINQKNIEMDTPYKEFVSGCKDFLDIIKNNTNYYDIKDIFIRNIDNSKKAYKDRSVANLIADFFVTGYNFLDFEEFDFANFVKVEKVRDFATKKTPISTKLNNLDLKIPLETIYISFDSDEDAVELDKGLGFLENGIVLAESTFPPLLKYVNEKSGSELIKEIKNAGKYKELLSVVDYLYEIFILDKIGVIDKKAFGNLVKGRLPTIDLDYKYNGDITPKKIIKTVFDIINELNYESIKEGLKQLEKFELIKYFCLANVLYNSGDPRIKEEIENLEKKIPRLVKNLLHYDYTHAKINELYYYGKFKELIKFINSNRNILENKIKYASSVYKRRYYNLFAKLFLEFYLLDASEAIINQVLQFLEKSEVEEIYRTKGTLAEVKARKGEYEEALHIYSENYKKYDDKDRTLSQKLTIDLILALKDKDMKKLEDVKDYSELLYYNTEDHLYALFNLAIIEAFNKDEEVYYSAFIEETSDKPKYHSINLQKAILYVVIGNINEAIKTLLDANFYIEAIDLLNSKYGREYKERYKEEYEDIKRRVNGYKDSISNLINIFSIEVKDTFAQEFYDKLFSDDKEELITYRTNIINYLL